jgi:hypothetical protein
LIPRKKLSKRSQLHTLPCSFLINASSPAGWNGTIALQRETTGKIHLILAGSSAGLLCSMKIALLLVLVPTLCAVGAAGVIYSEDVADDEDIWATGSSGAPADDSAPVVHDENEAVPLAEGTPITTNEEIGDDVDVFAELPPIAPESVDLGHPADELPAPTQPRPPKTTKTPQAKKKKKEATMPTTPAGSDRTSPGPVAADAGASRSLAEEPGGMLVACAVTSLLAAVIAAALLTRQQHGKPKAQALTAAGARARATAPGPKAHGASVAKTKSAAACEEPAEAALSAPRKPPRAAASACVVAAAETAAPAPAAKITPPTTGGPQSSRPLRSTSEPAPSSEELATLAHSPLERGLSCPAVQQVPKLSTIIDTIANDMQQATGCNRDKALELALQPASAQLAALTKGLMNRATMVEVALFNAERADAREAKRAEREDATAEATASRERQLHEERLAAAEELAEGQLKENKKRDQKRSQDLDRRDQKRSKDVEHWREQDRLEKRGEERNRTLAARGAAHWRTWRVILLFDLALMVSVVVLILAGGEIDLASTCKADVAKRAAAPVQDGADGNSGWFGSWSPMVLVRTVLPAGFDRSFAEFGCSVALWFRLTYWGLLVLVPYAVLEFMGGIFHYIGAVWAAAAFGYLIRGRILVRMVQRFPAVLVVFGVTSYGTKLLAHDRKDAWRPFGPAVPDLRPLGVAMLPLVSLCLALWAGLVVACSGNASDSGSMVVLSAMFDAPALQQCCTQDLWRQISRILDVALAAN